MAYRLGVDLGTTYTAAAVARGGVAQVVTLGERSPQIPSAVLLLADGTALVGEAAVRRGRDQPGRLATEFKRRIGDQTSLLIGGAPISAEALTTRLLRWVVDVVVEGEGGPPEVIVVTFPANWGPYRRELLQGAVAAADVGPVRLCEEPVAAASYFASTERVAVGSLVAVYDLGGGTFDAAVVRQAAQGFEPVGKAEGLDHLGGFEFDEAVFEHVKESLGGAVATLDPDDPDVYAALVRLRRDCTEAKEALSSDTAVTVPVALPGLVTSVRITRGELEGMLRPALEDTVACLRRSLVSAAVGPADLTAVVLAGGSARIPLVRELLQADLGRPVAVTSQPKLSVALGAALLREVAATEAVASSAGLAAASGAVEPDPTPSPPTQTTRPLRSVAWIARLTTAGPRWIAPLAVTVALVAVAVLLALLGPTDSGEPDPGAAGVVVAGTDVGSNGSAEVDLGSPVEVAFPGGDSRAGDTARLRTRLASVTISDPEATVDAEGEARFYITRFDQLLTGGPVHATVQVGADATDFLLVPVGRDWFVTIPGVALVIGVLFLAGWAEALLRPIRRRGRLRVVDVVSMALVGAGFGVALIVASWLGGDLLRPAIAIPVVFAMAGAGVAAVHWIADRGASKARGVPARAR